MFRAFNEGILSEADDERTHPEGVEKDTTEMGEWDTGRRRDIGLGDWGEGALLEPDLGR